MSSGSSELGGARKPGSTPLVFVAIGSNLGDSPTIVAQAIEQLQRLTDQPLWQSSLWRSEPVDCPPGSAPFINAVVGLTPRSSETPQSLLAKLQALEKAFGRQPKLVLNEPRPLDLDLVAFGNVTQATEQLTLPHPRVVVRRFVIQPLSEIAPDLVLPGQSKTVAQLLRALGPGEGLMRIAAAASDANSD